MTNKKAESLNALRQTDPFRYLYALATTELLLKAYQDIHQDTPLDFNLFKTIGKGFSSEQEELRMKELLEIVLQGMPNTNSPIFPANRKAVEVLEAMEKEHKRLSDADTGNHIYTAIYEQVLPYLVELRERAPHMKDLQEIHAIFNTLFFYKTAYNSGKEEKENMKEPLEKMENLLTTLSEFMAKKERDSH